MFIYIHSYKSLNSFLGVNSNMIEYNNIMSKKKETPIKIEVSKFR